MRFFYSTLILLLLGFGQEKLCLAADPPLCAKPLKVGDICKEKIAKLRPTQPDVGRYEVAIKAKKYAEKSEKAFKEFQLAKAAPVVIAPDGNYYLLDHHHTALAMSEAGHHHMYVKVEKDWSKIGGDGPMQDRMREFWNEMESAKPPLGYFRNEAGKAVDPLSRAFPKTLKATGNNRYRSLVYLLIEEKVIDINDEKYAEFYIGEMLRKLGVKIEGSDFDQAIAEAKKILTTPKAHAAIAALTQKGCGVMSALKIVILGRHES